MKKPGKWCALLSMVILVLIVSCSKDNEDPCVQVGGRIITESRAVGNFHSIEAILVGNIMLRQGLTQELEITTHENILPLLKTTVSNGVLNLELTGCTQGELQQLDVFITIPELRSISLSGVGDIVSLTDFQTDDLSIALEGVCNVDFSGQTNSFDLSISGVAEVSAFDLTAKNCTIGFSGSGGVEITATDNLDVTISGAGNVFYKGNPSVTSSITGSGSVVDSN